MPRFQKSFIKRIAYHPDFPLTFNYVPTRQSDIELVYKHFELQKPKNNDYSNAMACLIAEGVLAAMKDRNVSYSRRTNFDTGLQRYHGEHFTYKLVTSNLDEGTTKGLFVGQRAEPGDHRRTGEQSTFRASPELVKLFDATPFKRVENEIIRLKGRDDRLIAYRDTADTIRWRSELQSINRFLASIQITMPDRDIGLSSLIETEPDSRFVVRWFFIEYLVEDHSICTVVLTVGIKIFRRPNAKQCFLTVSKSSNWTTRPCTHRCCIQNEVSK